MIKVVHAWDGKNHICGSEKVRKGGPNGVYIQCCTKDSSHKHGRKRVTCKNCKKMLKGKK